MISFNLCPDILCKRRAVKHGITLYLTHNQNFMPSLNPLLHLLIKSSKIEQRLSIVCTLTFIDICWRPHIFLDMKLFEYPRFPPNDYEPDRYFVHFCSIKLWHKAVKSTGIWQMKMHCPPALHITGFTDSNNWQSTQILSQKQSFLEMSLRSKCLIDSGGSFRCLCDIFLGVFLKAASFQKTLAGEEGLFIASQDWDKNHIADNNPSPPPLFLLLVTIFN